MDRKNHLLLPVKTLLLQERAAARRNRSINRPTDSALRHRLNYYPVKPQAVKPAQSGEQVGCGFYQTGGTIEVARGFVRRHEPGVVDQGTGDGHPLLLRAGFSCM
jgi:hypothetical protein